MCFYFNFQDTTFSQCKQYNLTDTDDFIVTGYTVYDTDEASVNSTLNTIKCTHGWVYDTSQYKSTIVTDVSTCFFEIV